MTTKTRTMIQLDDSVIKELKRLAYENNTSVAAVVREAIDEYLQKHDPRAMRPRGKKRRK